MSFLSRLEIAFAVKNCFAIILNDLKLPWIGAGGGDLKLIFKNFRTISAKKNREKLKVEQWGKVSK